MENDTQKGTMRAEERGQARNMAADTGNGMRYNGRPDPAPGADGTLQAESGASSHDGSERVVADGTMEKQAVRAHADAAPDGVVAASDQAIPDIFEAQAAEDGVAGREEEEAPVESPSEDERKAEAARLEAIAQAVEEIRDRQISLQQDFEKFQARTEEQRKQWAARARRHLLEESLSVCDDLDRWLDAAPASGEEELSVHALAALQEGAEMVCTSFSAIIARFGLESPVPAVPQTEVAKGRNGIPEEQAAESDPAADVEDPNEEAMPGQHLERQLAHEHGQLRLIASAYKAYTRRVKAEREHTVLHARQTVTQALSQLLTSMRSTLDTAAQEAGTPSEQYAVLEDGMVQVSHEFKETLQQFDVSVMSVMDHPFDVERHEAVGSAPAPDKEGGLVIYEVRRGYMYGDQVLRYAQVIVAA